MSKMHAMRMNVTLHLVRKKITLNLDLDFIPWALNINPSRVNYEGV